MYAQQTREMSVVYGLVTWCLVGRNCQAAPRRKGLFKCGCGAQPWPCTMGYRRNCLRLVGGQHGCVLLSDNRGIIDLWQIWFLRPHLHRMYGCRLRVWYCTGHCHLVTLFGFYHCEMTITTTIPYFHESTLAGEGALRMQREPVAASWTAYHSVTNLVTSSILGQTLFFQVCFWFVMPSHS